MPELAIPTPTAATAAGLIPARKPASTDPQAALTAAMGLAALNPEQLAESGRSLLAAEARYDRMSGICGILVGLVMLEGKRRLEKGGFLDWLHAHFSKLNHGSTDAFTRSGDYRTANYRMRVAEVFLGKVKRTNEFAPEQLLLDEFAQHLAAEKEGAMDESNPVVAAVSAYVDGRSFRQLRDELPTLPRGGVRPRSEQVAPMTADEAKQVLREVCRSAGKAAQTLTEQRAWIALEVDAELDGLLHLFEDATEQVREWHSLSKTERAARLTAGQL